jgi:hypothetical protein
MQIKRISGTTYLCTVPAGSRLHAKCGYTVVRKDGRVLALIRNLAIAHCRPEFEAIQRTGEKLGGTTSRMDE